MSYLLPCRPRCLFFTVHRSFPPAFHFQIIPVVNPRQFIFILPPRKICQISPHTITFNFTFHEKTLPTTFSASARSSRKSSSPLRRLFTLHPNTLSCPVTVQIPAVPQIHPHMPPPEQQIPGLRPFLHQTHLLPFSPDRFHRIPFPDIRIPPNQNPIHQIHHKHHTRTVNPIRRLPAPPVLASKIPLRTLHNLPPKLLFRPPLRNPLLHKKPLFRFSPQKPIRIQSFS